MANDLQGVQTGQSNDTTVSKADINKLTADNATLKQSLETLQAQVTDPDYIAYVEGKRSGHNNQQVQQQPQQVNMQHVDLSKMTVGQFQHFLAQQQQEFAKVAINPQLQAMNQTLTNLSAKLELKDAESSYEDFNEYRNDIYNILSTSGNELTIDQAYHIARSNRPPVEGDGTTTVEAPKTITSMVTPYQTRSSSEKPGTTIPLDNDGAKKFGTKEAAALDAWSQVAARHGISGDTI